MEEERQEGKADAVFTSPGVKERGEKRGGEGRRRDSGEARLKPFLIRNGRGVGKEEGRQTQTVCNGQVEQDSLQLVRAEGTQSEPGSAQRRRVGGQPGPR